MSEREKRQWWAVLENGNQVQQVTGYSCRPNTPDVWWVPEVGFSLTEKHHLFDTEPEAIIKAIEELARTVVLANDNIEALQLRLRILSEAAKPKPVAA